MDEERRKRLAAEAARWSPSTPVDPGTWELVPMMSREEKQRHLNEVMVERFKPLIPKMGHEDLVLTREALEKKIALLDDAIRRHPDEITAVFEPVLEMCPPANVVLKTFIDKVELIEAVHGVTDSRKNQMSWAGYRFRLKGDPITFVFREGSNWCSEVCDVGQENGTDQTELKDPKKVAGDYLGYDDKVPPSAEDLAGLQAALDALRPEAAIATMLSWIGGW